jgi:CRISPR system Cascade subunit CasA
MATFNLVNQKWIPVSSRTSSIEVLSLKELLNDSSNYQEIVSENPGTDLAIYRFLLSLHLAANSGSTAIKYIEENIDFFDILDPHIPFLQDPNILESTAGQVYQAEKIHGSNTSTIGCHEHEWSRYTIDLAAGARLLLRLQLFDVGGRKTGATLSAGQMPCVGIVNTIVKGSSIGETLILNLGQYERSTEDRPSWEMPLTSPGSMVPTGYLGYLTYQFRRVRLFLDRTGKVCKAAVHPGNTIPKDRSAQEWEQHIPYRLGKKGTFPVPLNIDRLLWRDAEALIQSSAEITRPRIIDSVENLPANIKPSTIHISVYGLIVDKAKPLQWVIQNFSFPLEYLTDKLERKTLLTAIQLAEAGQQIFKSFRGSPYYCLAEVLKNDNPGGLAASLNGESIYWAEIDREFRLVLENKICLEEWVRVVRQIGMSAIKKSISSICSYEARAKTLNVASYYLSKIKLEGNENRPEGNNTERELRKEFN